MIELEHHLQIDKCPICGNNVKYSVGRWPGGVNDYGGWIVECSECHSKFPIPVKNPTDVSSIESGGIAIASWDDEVGDKEKVFAKHGLKLDAPTGDRLRVKEVGGQEETYFDLSTHHLFSCSKGKEPLDRVAYEDLAMKLPAVMSELGVFEIYYLKSREAPPDGIRVHTQFFCKCGNRYTGQFFRPFSESIRANANDFWLVDVVGAHESIDVDGVYTRDDCIAILGKLLLRWRATHDWVLLAAPFVGFNYSNAVKKVPDLWNWILKFTDPSKTTIITRRQTFNLFKTASKGTGFDVEMLKNWDLLNPTIEAMDRKRGGFKTDFHAKFYCGVSRDRVELLGGSFNIHTGKYVENLRIQRYDYSEFEERYLKKMKWSLDTTKWAQARCLLDIEVQNGNSAKATLVKMDGTRQ